MKKNYTKEIYKSRDEWLGNRGIGGSSASAVCGKSKWSDSTKVYDELVLKKKEFKNNTRMQEGTKAEEHIRFMFKLEHPEYKVTSPPKKGSWQFRRTDFNELTVTPDGLLKDLKTKKKLGLEIKDIELRKQAQYDTWMNDILPDEYYFQVLHYMVVMNDLIGVILVARLKCYKFNDNNEFVLDHIEERYYTIMREDVEEHINWLETKEIDFIVNNIRPKKRPIKVITF